MIPSTSGKFFYLLKTFVDGGQESDFLRDELFWQGLVSLDRYSEKKFSVF